MQANFKKIVGAVIILLAITVVAVLNLGKKPVVVPVKVVDDFATTKVIGKSVQGRNIDSYTFGKGDKHILFVGGMHGGYEWNSVMLAYQFVDYLKANRSVIPSNLTVTIIPSINPDGVFEVTGKDGRFNAVDVSANAKILATGRFNANNVDLNRNFDCKWQPKSTWQTKTTSAGTSAFSEPETAALRDFVASYKPEAVVFWHSQSNAVYASECKKGVLPATLDIMNAYSKASGYPAVKSFSAYPVTGDAEGWLASINIPAITVELKTHETVEWERNLAGVKALFDFYSKQK